MTPHLTASEHLLVAKDNEVPVCVCVCVCVHVQAITLLDWPIYIGKFPIVNVVGDILHSAQEVSGHVL